MRYIYLTAFLLLVSFLVVSGQRKEESISLPRPDDVARITIEPASMINWYTPESLRQVLPCLVPSIMTCPSVKQPQWGTFELKNGVVLRWMAKNKNSLQILTDKGERLFVLSPRCTRLQGGASDPDPVLLDISECGTGMAPRKRPLYFRLYKSGRLEYEISSRIDPSSLMYVVRKEIQLSRAIVKELIERAERRDFLGASGEYPQLRKMRDSGVVTSIVYTHQDREKMIVIRNYDPQHPRAKSYYPASLIRLLERVSELRSKDE